MEKVAIVINFAILSWHSPGRTEENHEHTQTKQQEYQLRLKPTTLRIKIRQTGLLGTLLNYSVIHYDI